MPTETQVDFRIWDHRSPEGDAIGVGFKEMGVMNGGLQRIPWTEPLCGGTLGSSEFFPRADLLQGRQTYWARPWDGRALLGPRRPVMGHLRLHVYSYAVMVSVIMANPCMGPRGTYRNVSVTSGLSVISGCFSGDVRQGLWTKASSLQKHMDLSTAWM